MTSRLPLETLAERALERYRRLRERRDEEGPQAPEIEEELASALQGLQSHLADFARQRTQRAVGEVADAAERERLVDLFEACPDAYLVTDMSGTVRAANRLAAQMLRIQARELKGKPLLSFVPLGFRPAVRRLVNRLAHDPTTIETLETPLVPRRGPKITAVLRVAAHRDGVSELLWTVRDARAEETARESLVAEVAERRRVDESLRRVELRYRYIVEHATDFVYELDAHGRFAFCNEYGVFHSLGYHERELLGKPLLEFVPVEFRDQVAAEIRRLLARPGTTGYGEFSMVGKDGRIVRFGQHASSVVRPSERPAIHAICRDITPQLAKLSELQQTGETLRNFSTHLQANVEAERKRIAREIHDELGATLTALRMELAMPPERGETLDGYRERDASLLRRLDAAIESKRRIVAGLRPSLLDNMGLCAAIEWLAQDVWERTGVACKVELEGFVDEPDADRATALYRIVQEAVTNALKHGRPTRLTIRQRLKKDRVAVDVVDNGRGIKRPQLTNRKAFGIVGMRERAAAFGGVLDIKGGPRGTRVSVLMPLSGGGARTGVSSDARAAGR